MKPDIVTAQEVRLQKVIAQAGVTSRRKAEALIVQGRVIVNGKRSRRWGARSIPTISLSWMANHSVSTPPCAMCCSTSHAAMSPHAG